MTLAGTVAPAAVPAAHAAPTHIDNGDGNGNGNFE
jgi:hypothetical protein